MNNDLKSLLGLFSRSMKIITYGKKMCFYGVYDAQSMKPEKSRDPEGLQQFSTNFWVFEGQSSYKKILQQIAKFYYTFFKKALI